MPFCTTPGPGVGLLQKVEHFPTHSVKTGSGLPTGIIGKTITQNSRSTQSTAEQLQVHTVLSYMTYQTQWRLTEKQLDSQTPIPSLAL